MLSFTIPGPPRTWKRVNIVNGRAMTDRKGRAHKLRIAGHARRAKTAHEWPTDGRFSVVIEVTEKNNRRGDLDNYAKAILDACNGVLWADDRQVDHLEVMRKEPSKKYPQTCVSVVFTRGLSDE